MQAPPKTPGNQERSQTSLIQNYRLGHEGENNLPNRIGQQCANTAAKSEPYAEATPEKPGDNRGAPITQTWS